MPTFAIVYAWQWVAIAAGILAIVVIAIQTIKGDFDE